MPTNHPFQLLLQAIKKVRVPRSKRGTNSGDGSWSLAGRELPSSCEGQILRLRICSPNLQVTEQVYYACPNLQKIMNVNLKTY